MTAWMVRPAEVPTSEVFHLQQTGDRRPLIYRSYHPAASPRPLLLLLLISFSPPLPHLFFLPSLVRSILFISRLYHTLNLSSPSASQPELRLPLPSPRRPDTARNSTPAFFYPFNKSPTPSRTLSINPTHTPAIINMVADALVYHPALAHYLRFVATTGTCRHSICPALLVSRPGESKVPQCRGPASRAFGG